MTKKWKVFADIAIIAVFAGCTDVAEAPLQQAKASQVVGGLAAWPERVRPEEKEFADLAKVVPSSGGFYRDANGTLHVYVRDANDESRASAYVSSISMSKRTRGVPIVRISIDRGQYTFGELARTRDSIATTVFDQISGVMTLDLDEVRNRVVVGIDESNSKIISSQIKSRISSLGLDTSMVALEPMARIRWQSNTAITATPATMLTPGSSLIVPFDSVVGGIKAAVTTPATCTVGFAAVRNGVPGFVLPTHCTSRWGGLDSTVAYNTSKLNGQESVDPQWYICGSKVCRNSDASFFATTTGVDIGVGLIARPIYPGINVDSNYPYYVITAVDTSSSMSYGLDVFYVGQATGSRSGTITNTCVDIIDATNTVHKLICVDEAAMYTHVGDSGSPILRSDGLDEVKLYGILAAGNGTTAYFSRMQRILNDLGGTITIAKGRLLSTPTIAGSVVGGYPRLSWSAVSGATRYAIYCEWTEDLLDEYGFPYTVYHDGLVGESTSTSFTDSAPVDTYTGTNQSGSYRKYHIVASSGSDVSPWSNYQSFSTIP